MTGTARLSKQFGQGILGQAAALVYTLLAVEVLFVITAIPGLVGLVFLERDASNVPLAALCAIPLGPALSAALFALNQYRGDLTDLHPARTFWRGYRINALGVLRLWIPWLVLLTVVGVNLANFDAANVPVWLGWSQILIALVATLWVINVLLITSLFAFRARDVARLAAHCLAATWRVTLGNACVLFVAGSVIYFFGELVLALLCSVFLLVLLRTGNALTEKVREEFTA